MVSKIPVKENVSHVLPVKKDQLQYGGRIIYQNLSSLSDHENQRKSRSSIPESNGKNRSNLIFELVVLFVNSEIGGTRFQYKRYSSTHLPDRSNKRTICACFSTSNNFPLRTSLCAIIHSCQRASRVRST